jgi:2-C-methyl-D-erythritol 4-phosphate cytidylyltransferase
VKAAGRYGAAVVGVPVKDTIKEVKSLPAGRQGQNSKVKSIGKTIDRKVLWQAQTPQAFRKAIILKAYASIKGAFTDDAGLVEKMGYPIKMVMGSYDNFKVTTPEDLKLMEAILKDRKV